MTDDDREDRMWLMDAPYGGCSIWPQMMVSCYDKLPEGQCSDTVWTHWDPLPQIEGYYWHKFSCGITLPTCTPRPQKREAE